MGWVEVKNWEGSSISASRRGGRRRAFLAKLSGKTFFTETLRAKFTGTLAYLALTNNASAKDIRYITLLESPRMDSALMLRASERLRSLVVRNHVWKVSVDAAVVNLPEWQARFPDYPARAQSQV